MHQRIKHTQKQSVADRLTVALLTRSPLCATPQFLAALVSPAITTTTDVSPQQTAKRRAWHPKGLAGALVRGASRAIPVPSVVSTVLRPLRRLHGIALSLTCVRFGLPLLLPSVWRGCQYWQRSLPVIVGYVRTHQRCAQTRTALQVQVQVLLTDRRAPPGHVLHCVVCSRHAVLP